jgi:putative transposase
LQHSTHTHGSGQSDPLPAYLHAGPVPRPANWLDYVHTPLTEAELTRLRRSVNRGAPFGGLEWTEHTAKRLALQASLRPRGRPKKLEK